MFVIFYISSMAGWLVNEKMLINRKKIFDDSNCWLNEPKTMREAEES